MKMVSEMKRGALHISLSGELDHHAAKEAMRAVAAVLEEHLPGKCILDMRMVSFMDSSGIALLLNINKKLGSFGGKLGVENVGTQPMKVIRASGVERIIKVKELEI